MKRVILSSVLMLSCTTIGWSQEICNDQYDNDLDYLVDCADPDCTGGDCETSFPCQDESQLFQISGNTFREWDGSAWIPITGWSNNNIQNINSIGYNVQDGYIYGVNPANNQVIRIDQNGAYALPNFFIPAPSGAGNWHTGDMDLNGHLYVTNMFSNEMIKVDIAAGTAVTIPFQGMPNNELGAADWTFNPVTGLFYGVLQTYDQNECTIRSVDLNGVFQGDFIVPGLTSLTVGQNFGGTFSDANGELYAFLNTGRFFQFTPDATFSNFTVTEITAQGNNPISNNDGASCPLSNGLNTSPDDCCEQVLALLNAQKSTKATTESKLIQMQEQLENLSEEKEVQEDLFVLHQNAPNPFNSRTTIKYEIHDEHAKKAAILIFELNGKLRHNFSVDVSKHGKLIIDAETLNSGMYIYTLLVNDIVKDSKKMILLD